MCDSDPRARSDSFPSLTLTGESPQGPDRTLPRVAFAEGLASLLPLVKAGCALLIPRRLVPGLQVRELLHVSLTLPEEVMQDDEPEIVEVHRHPETPVKVAEVLVGEGIRFFILKTGYPPGVKGRPPDSQLAGKLHQDHRERVLGGHELVQKECVPLIVGPARDRG